MEARQLFCINPNKKMKFCIYKGQMLTIKYNEVSKNITKHGGIVIDYENKDSECIILSHKSSIPKDEDVFNIKYVRHCISQNETLNLHQYRINKPVDKNHDETKSCISLSRILNDEKCIHYPRMTASEVLQKIDNALIL